MVDKIDRQQALDYELRSNFIASFIWFEWGQRLVANYFAWKVRRKYKRYVNSKTWEAKFNLLKRVTK